MYQILLCLDIEFSRYVPICTNGCVIDQLINLLQNVMLLIGSNLLSFKTPGEFPTKINIFFNLLSQVTAHSLSQLPVKHSSLMSLAHLVMKSYNWKLFFQLRCIFTVNSFLLMS